MTSPAPLDDYPPPPWHLRGTAWLGFLKTVDPMTVPAGLTVIGSPQRIIVICATYDRGTLAYREFGVVTLVRRHAQPAVFVHHLWVDNELSLRGGRAIWGLNKQLAVFSGPPDTPRIQAPDHSATAITWTARTIGVPAGGSLRSYARGEGDRWTRCTGRLTGTITSGRCEVHDWSSCLPDLATPTGRAFLIRSVRMTVR